MRKYQHYILLIAIIILSFLNLVNVSALNYQGSTNIGFTFNPTISVSISPNNLAISDLTPGTAADSNTITVNVSTNTAYGYSINASVGNNSTTYNNRNLNPLDNNISTNFVSLDYGSSVADKDNFNDNTWGYSYSLNNSTNWRPYSGLPLYSDTNNSKVLFSTYSPAYNTSLNFKIAAKPSSTQPAGEYTNVINFYATSIPEPPLLYDVVEGMTKGTLAENNVKLSDTITQANSGVYTYDPNIYGVASDASNDYPIYFYRGILDTDEGLGIYGSDGMADAWPNYVKLGNNTCWRIVRTTGSGGVKMIYNGLYGATTAGSCANTTGKAAAGSQAFGLRGNSSKNDWYRNINRIGYTFNNSADIQDITTPTSTDIVFGSNANYSDINTTNSNIKNYLENTWFTNMSGYESRLEASAGYCNDRSAYSDATTNSTLSEIVPYDTVSAMYFGAYGRNSNGASPKVPSLSCLRGAVDLYTVNGASNGNGQLSRPVALLTADEASFSGSGGKTAHSTHSYLYPAGDHFLLLSPYWRDSGIANIFLLYNTGSLWRLSAYNGNYVRPVISLMHHIQVTGGSGTATSPWTIE